MTIIISPKQFNDIVMSIINDKSVFTKYFLWTSPESIPDKYLDIYDVNINDTNFRRLKVLTSLYIYPKQFINRLNGKITENKGQEWISAKTFGNDIQYFIEILSLIKENNYAQQLLDKFKDLI
jgi:hypothetical protein